MFLLLLLVITAQRSRYGASSCFGELLECGRLRGAAAATHYTSSSILDSRREKLRGCCVGSVPISSWNWDWMFSASSVDHI